MRASLADRFDPRSNALGAMRLGLALTVAVAHALRISTGHQPVIGHTEVGQLAVDAFFVLSGFLVTRSLLRLDSVPRYLWHRFLRIAPGFWVCLLVTALVVAPLVAVLEGRTPLSVLGGADPAPGYLAGNATLLMRQYGISGLPLAGYEPGVLDGSLWTLFYEALCYLGLAVLGVTGVLRRQPVVVAGVAGLAWVAVALQGAGVWVGGQYLPRFVLMFLLGVLALRFADRIPVHAGIAAAAAVLTLVALVTLTEYRALAAPAFAYLCLWAVVALPLRRELRWDASYGVYIYHWPIQQVLVTAGAAALSPPVFVVLALVPALAAAGISWVLVERPALSLKDVAVRLPVRAGQ